MEEKSFDYMNVIPLVDVMLVLLTIVLTTSSFVVSGAIPVALPKASSSMTNESVRSHTVLIDARGMLYFNSTPVTLNGLRDNLLKLKRDTAIHVLADKAISVQACVDVLDLLAAEGFRKVCLKTEKRETALIK